MRLHLKQNKIDKIISKTSWTCKKLLTYLQCLQLVCSLFNGAFTFIDTITLQWLGCSGWGEISPALIHVHFGMHPGGPHKFLCSISPDCSNTDVKGDPWTHTHRVVILRKLMSTKLWNSPTMLPYAYRIGNTCVTYYIQYFILLHEICVPAASMACSCHVLAVSGYHTHLSLTINRAMWDVQKKKDN